ncbi:MAG: hypothetical protein IT245_03515 [Bacteroidia bacterium]|nr:hypothetical protein [Bacteroidia bacterium]
MQEFILRNLFMSNRFAFLVQPQLIVMFLVLLPPSMSHNWMIIVSFLAGFIFDVNFESWGIHAGISTLVGYTRYYATKEVETVIAARDEENQIWTSKKGGTWKWTYFLTFIAIYHFLYLLLESHGSNFFTRVLPAFISSTVIAFLLVLIFENVLYKPARN